MCIAYVNIYNFCLLCFWTCPLSNLPTERDVSETGSAPSDGKESHLQMDLMSIAGPGSVSETLCSFVNARERMKSRNSVILRVMYQHEAPLEFNIYKFVNCGHILELTKMALCGQPVIMYTRYCV
jgi:hypothetical protein